MAIKPEKIRQSAKILEKLFPKKKKTTKVKELLGIFSDLGEELRKEGKTSTDLVREMRETR